MACKPTQSRRLFHVIFIFWDNHFPTFEKLETKRFTFELISDTIDKSLNWLYFMLIIFKSDVTSSEFNAYLFCVLFKRGLARPGLYAIKAAIFNYWGLRSDVNSVKLPPGIKMKVIWRHYDGSAVEWWKWAIRWCVTAPAAAISKEKHPHTLDLPVYDDGHLQTGEDQLGGWRSRSLHKSICKNKILVDCSLIFWWTTLNVVKTISFDVDSRFIIGFVRQLR